MYFRKRPDSGEDKSLTFPNVFMHEIKEIENRRKKRGIPIPAELDKDLIGLAFSGGGIRSATFNLGVLQAFAKNHLLSKIDYLSTVSGGGYIGSWFSSWAYWINKKDGTANPTKEIENRLNRASVDIGELAEPHEVHFLRKYSNYLTPRLGIQSGDTLAFAGTYLRNLMLNQAILISALLALLLVPRIIGLFLSFLYNHYSGTQHSAVLCLILAIVLQIFVFIGILMNLSSPYGFISLKREYIKESSQGQKKRLFNDTATSIFWTVALPLFLFCFLLTYAIWANPRILPDSLIMWAVLTCLVYTGLWFTAACIVEIITRVKKFKEYLPAGEAFIRYRWIPVLWALPAGIIGGLLAWWSSQILSYWSPYFPHSIWYLLTFGVPLVTVLVLVAGVVHLGFIGREFDDLSREWFARLGGIVLGIAFCWFLACIATLFLPLWLHLFWELIHSKDKGWLTSVWQTLSTLGITAAVGGWIAGTLKGLLAAKSNRTGPRSVNQVPSKYEDLLVRIAPVLFITGLAALLSWMLYLIMTVIEGMSPSGDYWNIISLSTSSTSQFNWWKVPIAALVLFIVSRILGSRVDVNEFSLHNAYRNRLIRCYLGATNNKRRPEPFTGFDVKDNIFMHDLLNLGAPFHILNATLNVTKGKELALQTRKARSFIFTPLYSGFDFTQDESVGGMPGSIQTRAAVYDTADKRVKKWGSYRLTKHISWQLPDPGGKLGTAMAISGAAVSPNMGHYSSGSVSFLLTIFSVRLGWWLGNPRIKKNWESECPRSSWNALMRELTGNTNEDQSEVYLADGGHFDNLGVYELVRRRCRLIISCDAGADAFYSCGDLASVIEKCRVDFQTEITINLDDISPVEQSLPGGKSIRASKKAFAIGDISYPDKQKGKLIYIKPALNADLPKDVLAYANLIKEFPHQSTIDQFFDEMQFESYRSLGFACALSAVDAIPLYINDI
ncbi:MAG: hypothetical protein ABFD50_23405 [Smithella sp.]